MPYEAPANVLISADEIQQRVRELAVEIQRDYAADDQLHLVSVLKGGFIFLGDLVREMNRPVTIDFMAVSSYAKGTTTSARCGAEDLDSGLDGRNVIIVEDIVDTDSRLPTCRRSCTPGRRDPAHRLPAQKPSRRAVDVKVDYVGFTIEDRFVVGYGLDYAEQYRNLPTSPRWTEARRSTAARTSRRVSARPPGRRPGSASARAGPA